MSDSDDTGDGPGDDPAWTVDDADRAADRDAGDVDAADVDPDGTPAADVDAAADDDGVLDPDDIDLTGRDEVDVRGDGRYVISTEGGEDRVSTADSGVDAAGDTETAESAAAPPGGADGDAGVGDRADEDSPASALAAELDGLSAAHALGLAAKTPDGTDSVQVAADDPAVVVETALRWYARRVDPDGDPSGTVQRLLRDADLGGETANGADGRSAADADENGT
ncbi:DUF7500 family protein [Halobaculum sp. P14]|uniref:DUF7500 family protein n=1 Tax=Halobaculum sp. P14 TaxID=3421638 RepID=UPI003EC0F61D